jgi:hypothetical protein
MNDVLFGVAVAIGVAVLLTLAVGRWLRFLAEGDHD